MSVVSEAVTVDWDVELSYQPSISHFLSSSPWLGRKFRKIHSFTVTENRGWFQ